MKKIVLLVALVLFSVLSASAVLAAKDSIEIGGNETAANYTGYYISVTQLNSTIRSNEYVWYRALINISCNTTHASPNQSLAATVTDLNYTLGDEWANATTVAYIRIQNHTKSANASMLAIDQVADNIYSDGSYRKARFNLSKSGIEVTNTTNSSWYIIFRIAKVDDKKSVSTTSSEEIHYTENVTYEGPSDLDVDSVTIVYEPTKFSELQSTTGITWTGDRVTNYTVTASGIEYDPTIVHDTQYYLLVKYTIAETGHGATGAGRTPPLGIIPTITIPAMPLMIMVMGIAVVIILLIAIVYLSRR